MNWGSNMYRTLGIAGLSLLIGLGMGAGAMGLLQAQTPALKHTPLITHELMGIAGKDGFVVKVDYAPGVSDKLHRHPGQLFSYVLEGSAGWANQGEAPLTLKAGDLHYDPPNTIHNHWNASKTEPLKLLVFMVKDHGQPPGIPVEK
jgi:quercetin dioxygenase-like cupin family protein